jgi:hypothetical protein
MKEFMCFADTTGYVWVERDSAGSFVRMDSALQ